jgi:hypothetical protein
METNLARIRLVSVVAVLLGGLAEAQAREARVAVGAEIRNGDWFAIEPLGLVLLGGSGNGGNVAGTARGVLGLGGSGAAIGLATGLGGPCIGPGPCALRDSMFSSIISAEARVERMYEPTLWRSTTYVGPHLSFGGTFLKASVGWMFDVHDRADNHFQIGVGGGW